MQNSVPVRKLTYTYISFILDLQESPHPRGADLTPTSGTWVIGISESVKGVHPERLKDHARHILHL